MSDDTLPNILGDIASYYDDKIVKHGSTAQGVDWNGTEGQNLRFKQFLPLFENESTFSVTDVGCGYGAFAEFLTQHGYKFSYLGLDVSPEMITAAEANYKTQAKPHAISFELGSKPTSKSDFVVASGILNVKMHHTDEAWLEYVLQTIDTMNAFSIKGFAFNCLTSYSDAEKMQNKLYYSDPCKLFDICKSKYSRNVALLHDYELYEFTIIVRK